MNILWLHDHINDHKELDRQLKNFEKPIINFTDGQSCISFISDASQQNSDRPSILVVLNRIARQIVPEIHSYTALLFVMIFCTKDDNKIKWVSKYNKVKGVCIDPKELLVCLREMIKLSGLVNPFSCQLILLNDHPNEILEYQLRRLDSSLIILNQISLCLRHFEAIKHERPLMLIALNALGRRIVPEIHSNNQLKAIFIYCVDDNEKIKWSSKYEKIKFVTTSIFDLINNVRNEGLHHSTLSWHLVCLTDHTDETLQDRLCELDPCITTFDRFELCEEYLNSADKATIPVKPILFIAINTMGRHYIPEIHSNDRLNTFYIFVSPDSTNNRGIKWTTKYPKIKSVCTDLNELIHYIKQDAAALIHNMPQNSLTNSDISSFTTTSAKRLTIGNCIVCWLRPNTDKSNEAFQCSITKIYQIVDSFSLFIDSDDYIDYLTELTYEKVFLIISSSFAQHIVPLIHDIPQLSLIYLLSDVNELGDKEWFKDYSKIAGNFAEIESICEQLKQDVYYHNQDTMPISFASSSDSSNNVHLDRLDPLFMYSQLLKEILLDLEYTETSIQEFTSYCRKYFVNNNIQLQAIQKLETEYHHRSPVWWYTAESLIHSMLNKALRTFDIEITIKMGFFIRDLHRHLEQLHAEQSNKHKSEVFIVYRGQGLLTTDFEQMMKSQGGLISFNNFLSTSVNRSVSLLFAQRNRSNPGLIGILFQMKIDPSISSAPFATVEDISRWKTEEEILFSMHTVFRIHEINSIDDRLYEVNLSLTGDNDEQLQHLTEYIRREIGGDTESQRLGALLLEMGEYDKAVMIYETLLDAAYSSKDRQKVSSVFNQLGAIYSRKGEFDKALSYYKRSLEIKLSYLSPTDSSLSTIYSNIGSALRNQNQLNEALEYMQHALNTELQAPQCDSLKIASYRNNIGLVLTDQNRYIEALTFYKQALEIQQKHLPLSHPGLAISFNNIGTIYNEIHDYSKALLFYEKSLEIMVRSLPSNHPDLAVTCNNLGAIHNELEDYNSALIYYERSMKIMQNSLASNHPSMAIAYHNLALTHYRLQSYEAALKCGEKAVEICRHALKPDDPQMIACQETLNKIREKS